MRHIVLLTLLLLSVSSCHINGDLSDAYGNFEATEKYISTEIPGKIMLMNIEEGMTIQKNDLICLIDTVPYQLKLNQLMAQQKMAKMKIKQMNSSVAVLEVQNKTAKRDADRIHNMFADGAATPKQVDDVDGRLDVLKQQIAGQEVARETASAETVVIQTKIDELLDQLNRCRVVAPSDGTVLQKIAEQGELITAGKPVIKMADLKRIYLRAYITGNQLSEVKLGQKVEVLFDKDKELNQSIDGVISWISSSAEFTPKIIQTKDERVDLVYAIKVEVKNDDGRLKIGMPGEVKF